jgi:hypothetical protein
MISGGMGSLVKPKGVCFRKDKWSRKERLDDTLERESEIAFLFSGTH